MSVLGNLWACFRFPLLALEAVSIGVDEPTRRRPFAVIDGPQQRRHVVLANAAASKAGVRSGQMLASAQMLCPRLAVVPRDLAAERQALEALANWAYRFSADIVVVAPDQILVEIGASLALFGGWAKLERRLRAELTQLGFACALAVAPTASAAQVFALQADGLTIPAFAQLDTALGGVPLSASGLPEKIIATLHGVGLRQLHDVFRLPRAELARRIGEDALDHLDRLRGSIPEVLPRWCPAARYERRIEFSFGVESHGALAFPLQRLIREFALFLIARDSGVQRYALILGHERGASTRVEIGLLAPQREANSLLELARARLERIELVAPVHALTLQADDLPPLHPLHRDLFDRAKREQLDWPALAERLRARLGDGALHALAGVADHRPGRAWRHINVGTKAPATSRDAGRRPFWLLQRPIPLRGGPLRIIAGPERIESGWWDEGDQRRDYYIVETQAGQHAWAFIEAGSAAPQSGDGWNLHGWFA